MKFRTESALDLTFEGSTGSFKVGTGLEHQNSIEVKYLLTHVALDFSSRSNKVLQHIAPVREVFDLNRLSFDQLMQRDIDDTRVSYELIPYLLDSKSNDLIKLFPPIVVVVLPIRKDENQPYEYYPPVERDIDDEPSEHGDDVETYFVQAGSLGEEVFRFEQPIPRGENEPRKHDFVKLRINTSRTRLVIVDGQHRAMALLALYRNMMGRVEWSDERRSPYEQYYSIWTPDYIRSFNLDEINMPMILCTFPDIDETYRDEEGQIDLTSASRSIFLTLNKTARKVSESRNMLLDDRDLISYFLRKCLSMIKAKGMYSEASIRIFNVELDQFDDRLKLTDPIAVTGVNHLYYMIENLLLSDSPTDGIKSISANYRGRKDLHGNPFMKRLDGYNLLGTEEANATTRQIFTRETAESLEHNFTTKYGEHIVYIFEYFAPFEYHNRASLSLRSEIDRERDSNLKPILFEGQGIGRVFESFREELQQKIRTPFKNQGGSAKLPPGEREWN